MTSTPRIISPEMVMSPARRKAFDAKWIPEPNTGCWLWMGYVTINGYGAFHVRRGVAAWMAHRWAWMIYVGEIPPGMHLDHICRNRSCVNPDHLRVVTPRTNVFENSLSVSALNAAKTHCKWGHQFSTYRRQRPSGPSRTCLICNRNRARAYRAAQRKEHDP